MDPDLGRITVAEFGDRWIREHRLRERTRETYAGVFRRHIAPTLGRRELRRVTPDVVRAWRNELLKTGRSVDTTAKAYRLLRAILNTAVDDGRIRRNPCRLKGADVAPRAERPIATVKQVYKLAELIGERFRVFILAAGMTGLRWGELIALRRSDIDLDRGVIVVRRTFVEMSGGRLVEGLPKSAAGVRVVTVPGILIDELREHLLKFVGVESDALVFTGERGGTPKRGSWRSTVGWTAPVVSAGLPKGFHFHDLRHTGNHLAALSGASTRELMQRMGHSSMRAALIYQHATDQRAREIAERLSDVVSAEVAGGDEK